MKVIKEFKYRKGVHGHVRGYEIELRNGSILHIEDHSEATNGARILGWRGSADEPSNGLCMVPISGNVVDVFTCPLGLPATVLQSDG